MSHSDEAKRPLGQSIAPAAEFSIELVRVLTSCFRLIVLTDAISSINHNFKVESLDPRSLERVLEIHRKLSLFLHC